MNAITQNRIEVWSKLKRAGYLPDTEKGIEAGVIGSQPIRCKRHNFSFIAIPVSCVSYLENGVVPWCISCGESAILKAETYSDIDYLFHVSHKIPTELVQRCHEKFRKHSQHEFVSKIDNKFQFRCSYGGKFFSRLSPEIGGNKTFCTNEECIQERSKEKGQALSVIQDSKLKERGKQFNAIWSRVRKGEILCSIHGTQIDSNSSRCFGCDPRPEYQQGMSQPDFRKDLRVQRIQEVKAEMKARGLSFKGELICVCAEHEILLNRETLISRKKKYSDLLCEHCIKQEMFETIGKQSKETLTEIEKGNWVSSWSRIAGLAIRGKTKSGVPFRLSQFRGLTFGKANNAEEIMIISKQAAGKARLEQQSLLLGTAIALLKSRFGSEVLLRNLEITGANCGHVWKIKSIQSAWETACPECGKHKRVISHNKTALENLSKRFEGTQWKFISDISGTNNSRKHGALISCIKCGTRKEWCESGLPKGCVSCTTTSRNSQPGTVWIQTVSDLLGIDLEGGLSPEKKLEIESKVYHADGFIPGSVFEFLGDYYHGNPKTFPDKAKEYRTTFSRLAHIAKVYNVFYVWESDFKKGIVLSGFMPRTSKGRKIAVALLLGQVQP